MPIATHPEFTEEQSALKELARDFAQSRLAPGAAERDRSGEFPAELYREAAGLGLIGINFPERFGGGGLGIFEAALVLEQFAQVDGSFALTLGASCGLAGSHILRAGGEEQAARWLPPLTRGELGAWALTEPGSGSDAASLRCRAARTARAGGEGDFWEMTGSKMFISQGCLFSVMVVMARTGEGKGGISAFAVEPGDEGRESLPIHGKLGMRSMDTAEVVFEGCPLPADRLLGAEGEGFSHAMATLAGGRVGVGAVCCGLGQGALDAALAYVKERAVFGRPISDFGGVRAQLADCAIGLAAARELVFQAARLSDAGGDDRAVAAKAKLFSSEAALRVCDRSIQLHGGYGYTDEFPANRFWRDARLLTIGEGTSEVMRNLISRFAFGGR